ERLERGPRLALALDGEVELTGVEAATPVHRDDGAVRGIHRDERRLRPVGARQPLVDRLAREPLEAEVDRRSNPEAAAEHPLDAELVDQLLLHVLAEIRRLPEHAREVDVLRLRHW